MKTLLVTGANRGIGLECVRQYAQSGWHVIATCRSGVEELKAQTLDWGQVSVFPLDVASQQSIEALASQLNGQPIDVLLNNAGAGDTQQTQQFGSIQFDDARVLFDVNALAPLKLVEALLENIAASVDKTIAMISSDMGSISLNDTGGSYLYRASKAALNAITKTLAVDLKKRSINVVALHPGSVQTRMGGFDAAEISPEESVSGLKSVLDNLVMEASGSYLDYKNQRLPW